VTEVPDDAHINGLTESKVEKRDTCPSAPKTVKVKHKLSKSSKTWRDSCLLI
jgi:hypothetical protein